MQSHEAPESSSNEIHPVPLLPAVGKPPTGQAAVSFHPHIFWCQQEKKKKHFFLALRSCFFYIAGALVLQLPGCLLRVHIDGMQSISLKIYFFKHSQVGFLENALESINVAHVDNTGKQVPKDG